MDHPLFPGLPPVFDPNIKRNAAAVFSRSIAYQTAISLVLIALKENGLGHIALEQVNSRYADFDEAIKITLKNLPLVCQTIQDEYEVSKQIYEETRAALREFLKEPENLRQSE